MQPASQLEVGGVYRLLSGRFALLLEQDSGECLFHHVDVHRAREVPDGQLTLSPVAANRCRLAWHPHQWAQRVKERQDLETKRQADLDRWGIGGAYATAK